MAKRNTSSKAAKEIEKIGIPGIVIADLLELEDLYPEIRKNLAYIILPVLIIAQIRIAHTNAQVKEVQALDSVNTYIRFYLAKSRPLIYVCAAVAIRRTMVVYATSTDPNDILLDFNDLVDNISGKSSTRGSIATALISKERTREYRRGLMLQVAGTLQATSLHSPRRLAREVEAVTLETFLSRLPFRTDDLNIDDIYFWLNDTLGSIHEPRTFVDTLRIPNNKVVLEQALNISRQYPELPELPKDVDVSTLPAWQQIAIKQRQNLGGGKKL